MNELFTKLDDFIAALKANAVDAAKKASDALRSTADWIDQQASGVRFAASPEDIRGCEERYAQLHAIHASGPSYNAESGEDDANAVPDPQQTRKPAKAPASSATKPAGFGPGISIAIQIVLALLNALKQKQQPT